MTPLWWREPCRAVDAAAVALAEARQRQLTKPTGSLGQLEALAVRLAGLQGCERPSLERVAIGIFAGDHGVVAEGVSAYPQAVTGQMLGNFVGGGAAISVLARQLKATLEVVDLGTVDPELNLPGVRHLRLGAGTDNFLRGPAMTEAQVAAALHAGRDTVWRAQADGAHVFIGGEMGIGNTTAAAALASVLLGCAPSRLTGPGTGLDAAGVKHKAAVIEQALALHGLAPDDPLRASAQQGLAADHPRRAGRLPERAPDAPLQALTCVGGFEIAALAGAYLACAQVGIAVLVDGFICSVAALLATRLNPGCQPWLLYAHSGAEPGHARVLAALQAEPLLQLGLRLGEGSGAALAVPLLRLACALHGQMATFAEAAVADRPV
ncbi:nicotinate-nucleotide--dimethylbenzimidazole phosphoribosyltransferase [Pseudomonas sp. RP23018S]|uniref:nicotinate-nucleotide--dimethylbenzimidazole phosphoribosyltransferase n=1 Tax=Pseudomonas sp. RP23018S TaxID=3096037 RepID=UPI002ACAE929|nr:nicotinate-nucleotide--dimethylbenzimidazole phosphoribosyltransferase [Pseudomonas sp. RP23018S]MDZ5602057.1 nicotinate-nucleotide--dimethylbenzimidazole phosphoribosyltransferase [Pseudomonas sp. RP23018S]